MASKNKKAAAKKKNEKKNRQKAALAAKQALTNKKANKNAGAAAKAGKTKAPLNKETNNKSTVKIKLPKPGKKAVVVATCCIALVLCAVFAVYFIVYYVPASAVPAYTGDREPSANVSDISINLEKQLEKADTAKTWGNKKAFGFYADGDVAIKSGSDDVPLMLGNVDSNKCDFIITVLNEDRDIICRSMGLAPGKYLPSIKLIETLPDGEHDLKVYVAAYNSETLENIGVQKMNLKLTVGGGQTTNSITETQTTTTTSTAVQTTVKTVVQTTN